MNNEELSMKLEEKLDEFKNKLKDIQETPDLEDEKSGETKSWLR